MAKNGVTKQRRSTCPQKHARCKNCAGDIERGKTSFQQTDFHPVYISHTQAWKPNTKPAMVLIFLHCWPFLFSHSVIWVHVDRLPVICPVFEISEWRSHEFQFLFQCLHKTRRIIYFKTCTNKWKTRWHTSFRVSVHKKNTHIFQSDPTIGVNLGFTVKSGQNFNKTPSPSYPEGNDVQAAYHWSS